MEKVVPDNKLWPETSTAAETAFEGRNNEFPVPSNNRPPLQTEYPGPVFCKFKPFNICYYHDQHGNFQKVRANGTGRLLRSDGQVPALAKKDTPSGTEPPKVFLRYDRL